MSHNADSIDEQIHARPPTNPTLHNLRADSKSDWGIFTRLLVEPRVYLFLPPIPTWEGFQTYRETAINTPTTAIEGAYPLGCFGLNHLDEWK
jgi:hypothetical protein